MKGLRMKQKEYVCGFSHCLHSGEKVPSDLAVKDGTRYYHKDCSEEKERRSQIFDIYYKYYKTTEDYQMVRKAIVGFIEASSSEFVLYVLCQAIHRKVPFKGIFTLGWLVKNDMEIKKKYQAMKASEAVKTFTFDDVETKKKSPITYSRGRNSSWEETLFG